MLNLKFGDRFIPLKQLISLTSQRLILPFYHTISDERLSHIAHLYPVKGVKQFEADLDYLCRYFTPIDVHELSCIVQSSKPVHKPVFHLSFDDGLSEIYTVIAPILERKGIPATVFINTAFVDNQALFYRYKVSLILEKIEEKPALAKHLTSVLKMPIDDFSAVKKQLLSLNIFDVPIINKIAESVELNCEEYLRVQQPYLSKMQILALLDKGFQVGSHAVNHPFFKDIDDKERKRQITESFRYLTDELDIKQHFFSFPFSDEGVDRAFFDWLYAEANCQLSFGISGIKKDVSPLHLHRIPFEQGTTSAQNMLKNEYLYYLLKAPLNKNTIKRI